MPSASCGIRKISRICWLRSTSWFFPQRQKVSRTSSSKQRRLASQSWRRERVEPLRLSRMAGRVLWCLPGTRRPLPSGSSLLRNPGSARKSVRQAASACSRIFSGTSDREARRDLCSVAGAAAEEFVNLDRSPSAMSSSVRFLLTQQGRPNPVVDRVSESILNRGENRPT